jgi:hypothetical protein
MMSHKYDSMIRYMSHDDDTTAPGWYLDADYQFNMAISCM